MSQPPSPGTDGTPELDGLYRPQTPDPNATVELPAVPPAERLAASSAPAAPLHAIDEPQPRRRLWPYGVAAAALVLVAGAYAVGYVMAGDVVPRDSVVAGVPIGGLSREAATVKLTESLGPKAAAPITVNAAGKTGTIQPAQAGLAVDIPATVEASGVGRSWAPSHIWRVMTGGGTVDPVVRVDRTKLDAAVTTLASTINAKATDATLAYKGLVPTLTPGVTGVALDVPATADAVRAGYLATTTVAGKAAVTEPAVTTAEAQSVLDAYAKPAVSGPIALDTGKGVVTITPEQIAAATTFPAQNDTIAGATDVKALYAAAQPAIKALNFGAPKDATIALGPAGTPVITPSTDGLTLSEDEFVKAATPLITAAAPNRTGKPTLTAEKPAFTTEAAEAMGVKEVIGEFTTYFPHSSYRNNNIGRAAASINNTFVKPGETFSLNQVLGERTKANGYVEGYAIVGGRMVLEYGGGVSQSATTTFNAIFFAGLKDVTHTPHMFYLSRYPAGREATVYWGSIDLKFANDSKYGVLMQAYIKPSTSSSQGSITVKVWSTKTYEKVVSSELRRSNYTTGGTRTVTGDPRCSPQSKGQGFDVNYERIFYQNGQVARTEKFFHRYSAQDEIICA